MIIFQQGQRIDAVDINANFGEVSAGHSIWRGDGNTTIQWTRIARLSNYTNNNSCISVEVCSQSYHAPGSNIQRISIGINADGQGIVLCNSSVGLTSTTSLYPACYVLTPATKTLDLYIFASWIFWMEIGGSYRTSDIIDYSEVLTGITSVSTIPANGTLIPATTKTSAVTNNGSLLATEAQVYNAIPVGTIIMRAVGGTISGHAYCNGDILNPTTNPECLNLYNALGTTYGVQGQLPDFRGYFLRGAEGTNSAAVGVAQTDAIRNIKGSNNYGLVSGGQSGAIVSGALNSGGMNNMHADWHRPDFDANAGNSTNNPMAGHANGADIHPQNYSVYYYIKY